VSAVLPLGLALVTPGGARFADGAISPASDRARARAAVATGDHLAAFPAIPRGGLALRHEQSGLVFTHWQLNGTVYRIAAVRPAAPPLEPGQPVTVVTGSCLFGAGTLAGTINGQPTALLAGLPQLADPPGVITSVDADPALHVYETETARVLGGFLRDLAALPGVGPVTVYCHIPVPEYRIWGADLTWRGLMTIAAYSGYSQAVAARGRAVTRAFAAAAGGRVTLHSGSPLTDRAWGLWGAATREVSARESADTTVGDLSNLSCASLYLAAARFAAVGGSALLIVENPDELPIWLTARRLGDCPAAAVRYIHPRLVATTRHACLYDVPAGKFKDLVRTPPLAGLGPAADPDGEDSGAQGSGEGKEQGEDHEHEQ
jgi:hypothetical protein